MLLFCYLGAGYGGQLPTLLPRESGQPHDHSKFTSSEQLLFNPNWSSKQNSPVLSMNTQMIEFLIVRHFDTWQQHQLLCSQTEKKKNLSWTMLELHHYWKLTRDPAIFKWTLVIDLITMEKHTTSCCHGWGSVSKIASRISPVRQTHRLKRECSASPASASSFVWGRFLIRF